MVPIHDTDLADERWKQGEWRHYEFWEEVETRLRHKKKMWIGVVVALFLLLLSYPVIKDRMPKWRALQMTRELARQIGFLRRMAVVERVPMRLRFTDTEQLKFVIEKVKNCQDPSSHIVQAGALADPSAFNSYRLLTPELGQRFGFNKLIDQYCFEPHSGGVTSPLTLGETGFAVIPVKDLADGRSNRIAVLLLQGNQLEISFNF